MRQNLSSVSRRGVLVGAGGLAAACASGPATLPSDDGARALPAVQRVLDGWIADGRLSGATVAVRRGDGPSLYLQAGRLDHDPATALTDRNTLFRIYSMTKPVTGVCAALLIEDGRLTLDTPVAEYVPEFAAMRMATDPTRSLDGPAARSVMTVRHLLTHTAGLTYHFIDQGGVWTAYRRAGLFPVPGYNLAPDPALDASTVRDLDEMGRRLGEIPLLFEPGSEFSYSCSLDVLGLVIQRASGMSFQDFMRRRLLEPAGMEGTGWSLPRGDQSRLMQLYDYADQTRVVRDDRLASAWSPPISLYPGGAGLLSSAKDYLAFLTMLLDEGRAGRVRVMRPETARLVMSNILPPGVPEVSGQHFGFGGSVNKQTGEYGWSGAAGTVAWADPGSRTAVTVMVQHFGQTIAVSDDIRRALAQDTAA